MTTPKTKPALVPDPEVSATPRRRTFTAAYKARIVGECAQASEPGEINAILRREGLYSSHLSDWRRRFAREGTDGLRNKKNGRPAKSPLLRAVEKENKRLQRQLDAAKKELHRANLIIEAQKKLAQLLVAVETPSSEPGA